MKSVLNSLTTEDKGNTGKLNWPVLTISLLILSKKITTVYNVILFSKILIFNFLLKLKNTQTK